MQSSKPLSPKKPDEANWFRSIKKYAVYYGLGGAGCLQALKYDFFTLPPNVTLYAGWILSTITLCCIFLAGGGPVMDMIRRGSELIKKLRKLDDEEEV